MARHQLLGISCASTTEVWRHAVDFLLARNGIADYSASGMGWSMIDSQFAVNIDAPAVGDWVVIGSAGEDGKQRLRLQMIFATLANSIIQTRSGLGWNTSTNAWYSSYPAANVAGGPTTGSAFTLWIFGTLDAISIVIGNGTANYLRHYGLADNTMYDQEVMVASAAITAGANRVVGVDAVPELAAAGMAVIVRDGVSCEKAVLSVVSGTNLTLSLTNSYASGAHISLDYSTVMACGPQSFASGVYGQIGRDGKVGGTSANLTARFNDNLLGDCNPDLLNSDAIAEQIMFTDSSSGGYHGCARDVLHGSSAGYSSGLEYTDRITGNTWRALSCYSNQLYLFRQV